MNTTQTPDINTVLLPKEAAAYLHISTQALGRFRRQGRVKGTRVGESKLFTYTLYDLRNADIVPRKRGRRSQK